jgi:hypothetical protein
LISGVVVSAEEIKASVKALVEKKKKDLDSKRYQISGMLLGALRKEQPWANSLALKEELDAQVFDYLGPKEERDDLKAMVILFFNDRKRKKKYPSWSRLNLEQPYLRKGA